MRAPGPVALGSADASLREFLRLLMHIYSTPRNQSDFVSVPSTEVISIGPCEPNSVGSL